MRQYAPVEPPTALTIAGSDSGGGAGIQADLKTMEAHGVFGTSVITAVTAQNSLGVESSHVLPTEEIATQYEAVASDFEVSAAKTGMLATADVIETVADCLAGFDGPVVVDPVMVAATGDRLLSREAETAYEELVARSTVVTPNADEATVLTDLEVDDIESAARAGEQLVDRGADAALVKGGHLGSDRVVDTLVIHADDDYTIERFDHGRIDTDATHGSGCTLSAAIAARMARGEPLGEAIAAGVSFMQRAVRYGIDVGEGPGAVHHLSELRNRATHRETAGSIDAIESTLETTVAGEESPLETVDLAGCGPYAEFHEEAISRRWRPDQRTDGGGDPDAIEALFAAREITPDLRFLASVAPGPSIDGIEDTVDRIDDAVGEIDDEDIGRLDEQLEAYVVGEAHSIEDAAVCPESPIVVPHAEADRLLLLSASGSEIETLLRSIVSDRSTSH